ncbi:inositol monophosphatase family protein [Marinomonas sp.]
MQISNQDSILEQAVRLAGEKAQVLRQQGLSITTKGRQDFVSQADLAVEKTLKQTILALYPNDAFLGEEGGFSPAEEPEKTHGIWVIDPIDGTSNYLQNMDYWCVSVAYVVQGEIQLGLIYAPDRNEFFFTRKGEGSFLNGEKLSMSEPEVGQVIIGLGRSNRRPLSDYLNVLTHLDEQDVEYRRFGAGALMLAHVACGQVHGYFEAHLNSWDALAGLLLIEQAGGKVPDFLANDGLLKGNSMWAASPKLWAQLSVDLGA